MLAGWLVRVLFSPDGGQVETVTRYETETYSRAHTPHRDLSRIVLFSDDDKGYLLQARRGKQQS